MSEWRRISVSESAKSEGWLSRILLPSAWKVTHGRRREGLTKNARFAGLARSQECLCSVQRSACSGGGTMCATSMIGGEFRFEPLPGRGWWQFPFPPPNCGISAAEATSAKHGDECPYQYPLPDARSWYTTLCSLYISCGLQNDRLFAVYVLVTTLSTVYRNMVSMALATEVSLGLSD